MITVDAPDCYGWLLSPPSTTVFSKMHLTTPRRHQIPRSHSSHSLQRDKKLAATRATPTQSHHLFTLPGSQDDAMDEYSESSLSDTSFEDEHIYPLYCTDTRISEGSKCKDLVALDAESERIWALFWSSPKDESPLQAATHQYLAENTRTSTDDRLFLPSLISDLGVTEYPTTLHRSDAILSSTRVRTPLASHKFRPTTQTFLPAGPAPSKPLPPPPPPPKDNQEAKSTHSQHNSWPTHNTLYTPPSPRPSVPSRPQAHRSKSAAHLPSKLNNSMIDSCPHPARPAMIRSPNSYSYPSSSPTSPSFPVPLPANDDLMCRMQKSVFDWESDSEDSDEKREFPEWIRKLNRKRANNVHNDGLAKPTSEFAGKDKKSGKSFSAMSEVLKKSLRIRRNGDI
jgi:hypothetical protein